MTAQTNTAAFEDGLAMGFAQGRKEGIEEAIEIIARWLDAEGSRLALDCLCHGSAADAIRSGSPWSGGLR